MLQARIYSGSTLKATYTFNLKCRSITSPVWTRMGTVPEGTVVQGRINVSGFDIGAVAYFDIYEDDIVFNDLVTRKSATYTGGSTVSFSWTSAWHDDGLGGDPEFFFKASTLTGDLGSVVTASSSPTLEVFRVGSVRATIEPSGARNAGARWRLTSGPDTSAKDSGVTLSVPQRAQLLPRLVLIPSRVTSSPGLQARPVPGLSFRVLHPAPIANTPAAPR